MITICSRFIGSFKLGDNINYNLRILSLLYATYSRVDDGRKRLLCKPIIILNTSIIEAVLHDFVACRIRSYTREGVNSLLHSIVGAVRGKQIDEFEKYIACARKHDLLKVQDDLFYDKLDFLRKLRNRVHIQNTKGHFEFDDGDAFTEDRKLISEECLKKVLQQMEKYHLRDESIGNHVDVFVLPWD